MSLHGPTGRRLLSLWNYWVRLVFLLRAGRPWAGGGGGREELLALAALCQHGEPPKQALCASAFRLLGYFRLRNGAGLVVGTLRSCEGQNRAVCEGRGPGQPGDQQGLLGALSRWEAGH